LQKGITEIFKTVNPIWLIFSPVPNQKVCKSRMNPFGPPIFMAIVILDISAGNAFMEEGTGREMTPAIQHISVAILPIAVFPQMM
jgi:hypothetical protein